MITVRELTKRYGERTAVQGVSFEVEPGEIVGFLGPNGAGKTTTLRMITGFLPPTEGDVRVNGIDVVAEPVSARRCIGYMPEGVPLHDEMRVHEYLAFRARLKGVERSALKRAVGRALEMAAIEDVQDRIIRQLSKGYKQRVGLADAVIADPPLLILDEPTSGLDPNQMRQVRELIRGFATTKTVFLSTHILPEVEATCSRVVIVHRGQLVGEGTPETLGTGGRREQRVAVRLRAPSDETVETVVSRLAEVAGVLEVGQVEEVEPQVVHLTARTESGPDVLERLSRTVIDAGWALRSLGPEDARLEDVFTALTTEEPGQAGNDANGGEVDARSTANAGSGTSDEEQSR